MAQKRASVSRAEDRRKYRTRRMVPGPGRISAVIHESDAGVRSLEWLERRTGIPLATLNPGGHGLNISDEDWFRAHPRRKSSRPNEAPVL